MTKKKPPAIRDRIVDFRRVPASSLIPNPSNWRTHPEEQRAALAGVLESVGIVDAVIARETPEGLELIDGHLRQETLTGDIPVIVVDLNDEEAAEVLATFDPLTALAGIDAGKLEGLLDGLTSESEAVDKMLADLKLDAGIFDEIDEDLDAEPQVDRADELREAWGTEAGQLWALGDHRVLCGDSTKAEDVERVMGGEVARLSCSDPPYQIDTVGGGQLKDDPKMKAIREFGIDTFDPSAMSQRSRTEVFFCNKPMIPDYISLAKAWGVSWDLAVSHKTWHAANWGGHLATDLEYIFIIGNQAPIKGQDAGIYSKLFTGQKTEDDSSVGWAKPVALIRKFILLFTKQCEHVADWYIGSGTTLIAAEQLNRRCFGIEISPAYVAVILQRYADATGKQPTLIEGE